MAAYTVKITRKSEVGVAKGYPFTLAHGTWDEDYDMFGGDFLSKNGLDLSFQIPDIGILSAINSQSSLYAEVSGTSIILHAIMDGAETDDYTLPYDPTDVTTQYVQLIATTADSTYEYYRVIWASTHDASNYYLWYNVAVNLSTGIISVTAKESISNITTIYRPLNQSGIVWFCIEENSPAAYKIRHTSGAAGGGFTLDIDTVGDIWRVNDAYWVMNPNSATKILRSLDTGETWSEINGGDGSTNYSVVATDGTYIYATKSGETNIYKGTLDGVNVTWENIFSYGTFTLNGVDADSAGHLALGLVDGADSYMIVFNYELDLIVSSMRIKKDINTVPSVLTIDVYSNTEVQQNFVMIDLFDKDDVNRFRGYVLPSKTSNQIVCESVDRVLKSLAINEAFSAKSLHDIFESLSDASVVEIDVNNLDDIDTFNQDWGAAVPRYLGMNTIAMMGAGFWRTKVNTIDAYLVSTPHASGTTITWGTTTAKYIGDRPAIEKSVNKLVVYGAYSLQGELLQKTYQDAADQAIRGIVPVYIRRNDLQTYDALVSFASELWSRRKSTEDFPKIFTIAVYGYNWLHCGDTIAIVNGSFVSSYLVDTSYIILSTDIDIVRGRTILEISTVTGFFADYSDSLPILSQIPIMAADSTEGDQKEQVSLADVLAGKYCVQYNDLNISMSGAKVPAANTPTFATFTTNTKLYTFAIDDYADVQSVEVLHDYVEGSDLEIHLHIISNGLDANERKAKYTIYYVVGDQEEDCDAEGSATAELTIPANTPDKHHFFLHVGTISGTNFKMGAALMMRAKRIAGTGTEPSNDPFVPQVGCHYKVDQMGSNQETVK